MQFLSIRLLFDQFSHRMNIHQKHINEYSVPAAAKYFANCNDNNACICNYLVYSNQNDFAGDFKMKCITEIVSE